MLSPPSMDPFVRRLIRRLVDPAEPLSRNRHFHVFNNPEGRYALRISKRLQGLKQDILAAQSSGSELAVDRRVDGTGVWRIELTFRRLGAKRVATLTDAEYELLRELPGVTEALRPPATAATA